MQHEVYCGWGYTCFNCPTNVQYTLGVFAVSHKQIYALIIMVWLIYSTGDIVEMNVIVEVPNLFAL